MNTRHLFSAALFALSIAPAASMAGKTTICHIPPGNPANAHAITVSDSAVAAHQAQHGDTILPAGGTCGTATPVVPANKISAAVEICGAGSSRDGRRIDVAGVGGVLTKTVACGGS